MANIRRLDTPGGVRYQADIRIKGYPRKTRLFRLKRDAVAWSNKIETRMREGTYDPAAISSNKTVGDVIEKYLETIADSNYKSEQYRADLKHRLHWWKTRIGNYMLCNIRPRLLSAERDKMLKGKPRRSSSTINRYFSALSAVFNKCVNEWQYMEYNPVKSIKPLREPAGRNRFLSEEERKRLLRVAKMEKHKPMYALIVLAIATGARRSELLGIKCRNVLIEQKKIIIEDTKNGTDRALYINGHPLELVKILLKRAHRKKYLFTSKRGDVPITIEREWRRMVDRAGLENFRFHDLRHTAAAYFAMNGATLNEIAELLGHKNFNMTKRYAHITDSHLKNVSGRVQRQVFNQNVIME